MVEADTNIKALLAAINLTRLFCNKIKALPRLQDAVSTSSGMKGQMSLLLLLLTPLK